MSEEDNIALVRRMLDALGNGDVDEASHCFAPEARNHGQPRSRDAMGRVFESLHMLQERQTIEDIFAAGDKVACRTVCRGVHAATPMIPVNGGILRDVPPTGREYTVQHIHIFECKDGQIVAHWANRDDLSMAQQIGFTIGPPVSQTA